MANNLTTAFNNHFFEFVDDIQSVFPDDPDIRSVKNALTMVRKANPKMLVKMWLLNVYSPYRQEIDEGNIQFFITKDYSTDLEKVDGSTDKTKIMDAINRLRKPIEQMSVENQQKTMKYIQNLSKLSTMVQ